MMHRRKHVDYRHESYCGWKESTSTRIPGSRKIVNMLETAASQTMRNFLTIQSSGDHQANGRTEEKNLSPRNMKACHIINTALMQSVTKT
jgi:hypothetical protein